MIAGKIKMQLTRDSDFPAPGLTQGKCSMFGAWGSAIPVGGSLLQLRALDWNMDGEYFSFSFYIFKNS